MCTTYSYRSNHLYTFTYTCGCVCFVLRLFCLSTNMLAKLIYLDELWTCAHPHTIQQYSIHTIQDKSLAMAPQANFYQNNNFVFRTVFWMLLKNVYRISRLPTIIIIMIIVHTRNPPSHTSTNAIHTHRTQT